MKPHEVMSQEELLEYCNELEERINLISDAVLHINERLNELTVDKYSYHTTTDERGE